MAVVHIRLCTCAYVDCRVARLAPLWVYFASNGEKINFDNGKQSISSIQGKNDVSLFVI